MSRSATRSVIYSVHSISNFSGNKQLYKQILVQSYDGTIIYPENSNFVKGEPENDAI